MSIKKSKDSRYNKKSISTFAGSSGQQFNVQDLSKFNQCRLSKKPFQIKNNLIIFSVKSNSQISLRNVIF